MATELGINGTQFTLNGTPTFLYGISYYGALGAPEEFIRRDLDDGDQKSISTPVPRSRARARHS